MGSFEGPLALKFVLIKNYNLPLPRPKTDVQVTKEAFSSQKRTSGTSKHDISQIFSTFVGHFCPSWIRIRIRIPNTDPDPLTRLDPDPQPCFEGRLVSPFPAAGQEGKGGGHSLWRSPCLNIAGEE
jgi:hypothetical protein